MVAAGYLSDTCSGPLTFWFRPCLAAQHLWPVTCDDVCGDSHVLAIPPTLASNRPDAGSHDLPSRFDRQPSRGLRCTLSRMLPWLPVGSRGQHPGSNPPIASYGFKTSDCYVCDFTSQERITSGSMRGRAPRGCGRWGKVPRSRPAGGGSKPPQAASVKSRGGERCGKGASHASGVGREGERK